MSDLKNIPLGTKLRDKVTDLEGTAIARIEYLNGCVQYSIKPKIGKDGKVNDGEWVDSQQIEVLTDKPVNVKSSNTGGASSIAPRL
jgi:hypothetical protein